MLDNGRGAPIGAPFFSCAEQRGRTVWPKAATRDFSIRQTIGTLELTKSDDKSRFTAPESEPIFVAVPNKEKDLHDAYSKASETMVEFKKHVTTPGTHICSVKLKFRDPKLSEELGEDRFAFIWLTATHFHDEDNLYAVEFFEVPKEFHEWHQVGQRLAIEAEDVFDWMVNYDGYVYGGFTLRAVKKHLSEADKAAHDEYLGVNEWAPIPSGRKLPFKIAVIGLVEWPLLRKADVRLVLSRRAASDPLQTFIQRQLSRKFSFYAHSSSG